MWQRTISSLFELLKKLLNSTITKCQILNQLNFLQLVFISFIRMRNTAIVGPYLSKGRIFSKPAEEKVTALLNQIA